MMKRYDFYVVFYRRDEKGNCFLSGTTLVSPIKRITLDGLGLLVDWLKKQWPDSKDIVPLNWKYLGKAKDSDGTRETS